MNKLLSIFSGLILLIAVTTSCSETPSKGEPSPGGGAGNEADADYSLSSSYGVAVAGGKYTLSGVDGRVKGEPYIVEVARSAHNFGFQNIKIFLKKGKDMQRSFGFFSDWNLPDEVTWVELMEHEYFDKVFEFGFKTIIFNITDHDSLLSVDPDLFAERYLATGGYKDIYDLVLYLQERFQNRDITFIISNWEGDWILRNKYSDDAAWDSAPKDFVDTRVANFITWTKLRQEAVTKARDHYRDVMHRESKCKVYFAVEANKVTYCMNDDTKVGVATRVLPNVEVDMVSWSAYDGNSRYNLKRGVEFLREQHHSTGVFSDNNAVFLGECGMKENTASESVMKSQWDEIMAVCEEMKIPYVMYWAVYCSGFKDSATEKASAFDPENGVSAKASELRGHWVYRPDGSLGYLASYDSKYSLDRILSVNRKN